LERSRKERQKSGYREWGGPEGGREREKVKDRRMEIAGSVLSKAK